MRSLALLLRAPASRQSLVYASTTAAASAIGALTVVLLAKTLTVAELGAYSFACAFLGWVAMFFEFGFLSAVVRWLPRFREQARRELLGAATLTLLALGITFAIAVYALSFCVDNVFQVEAAHALRVSAFISFGWVWAQGALMLSQGAERVGLYSAINLAAKVAFPVVLVLIAVSRSPAAISLTNSLAIQSLVLTISFGFIIAALGPRLRGAAKWFPELWHGARAFGFSLYTGRILSMGTYTLDALLIAWLSHADQVAFYSLAGSMAAVAAIPATAISTAFFGRLARVEKIPNRWRLISLVASLGTSGLVVLLSVPFVLIVLGGKYREVLVLVPILALAQSVGGYSRMYNSFLWGHGYGAPLRTAAIALTVSNLVLNFSLIPMFGARGAAVASLGAMLVNLSAHVRGYRRALRSGTTSDQATEPQAAERETRR